MLLKTSVNGSFAVAVLWFGTNPVFSKTIEKGSEKLGDPYAAIDCVSKNAPQDDESQEIFAPLVEILGQSVRVEIYKSKKVKIYHVTEDLSLDEVLSGKSIQKQTATSYKLDIQGQAHYSYELTPSSAGLFLGSKTASVDFMAMSKNERNQWQSVGRWKWSCKNVTPADQKPVLNVCDKLPKVQGTYQCQSIERNDDDLYGRPKDFSMHLDQKGVQKLEYTIEKGSKVVELGKFIPNQNPAKNSTLRYIEYCNYGFTSATMDGKPVKNPEFLIAGVYLSPGFITGEDLVVRAEELAGDGGSSIFWRCQKN